MHTVKAVEKFVRSFKRLHSPTALGLVNTSHKKENVKECMRVAWDSQMGQLASFFCK